MATWADSSGGDALVNAQSHTVPMVLEQTSQHKVGLRHLSRRYPAYT